MPEHPPLSSLRETRQHGPATFPCAFYRADSTLVPSGVPFAVKHHWHDMPEVIYFERGVYQVEINMQQRTVDRPCICFINSGELHALVSQPDDYQEQAFVFSPGILRFDSADLAEEQLIAPLLAHRLAFPAFFFEGHPAFAALESCFLGIRAVFYRENTNFPEQLTVRTPAAQLRIRAHLLTMLAVLAEQHLLLVREPAKDPRIELLKQVITYIHENYRSPIRISELADIAGLNEQYFCRFFRQALGKTPVGYINEYRIRQAASLLRATDIPVSEVCMECGFNNFGHFAKEFKKSMQLTPLQFRKAARAALL